jgi:3-methyladenine DNA glycosylase AlkC
MERIFSLFSTDQLQLMSIKVTDEAFERLSPDMREERNFLLRELKERFSRENLGKPSYTQVNEHLRHLAQEQERERLGRVRQIGERQAGERQTLLKREGQDYDQMIHDWIRARQRLESTSGILHQQIKERTAISGQERQKYNQLLRDWERIKDLHIKRSKMATDEERALKDKQRVDRAEAELVRSSSMYRSPLTVDKAYRILGLPVFEELSAVKKSYHRLSLMNHPDRVAVDDPERPLKMARFKYIVAAYDLLSEVLKR